MTRFFINEHSASQKHPKVEAKKVRRMALPRTVCSIERAIVTMMHYSRCYQGWFGGMLGGGGEDEAETKNDMRTLQARAAVGLFRHFVALAVPAS
jgi:hypothetical protein